MENYPTGNVTFLFTDVSGSSVKWDRDRAGMRDAIRKHDKIIEEAVSKSGTVVKKMGDGIMAVFENAREALYAAVASQRSLATESWSESIGDLSARMGLHRGFVEQEDEDYFGPVVNIAARIEAAAHGGQIVLSRECLDCITESEEGIEFRDLGSHYLRGLSSPHQLFQVVGSGLTDDFPPLRTESKPDKPTIAILPFETMGNQTRSSFADGLVEDLLTALARCRDLFVIARNSTFVYKGMHVDIGQVAAKLGVRYVMEGSVRWAGDTARVTVQLIDGTTGGHIWAENYDKRIDDVFGVIDEINADIVAHLSGYHGILVLSEKKRSLTDDPGSLGDYESYMMALDLKHRFAEPTNIEARELLSGILERRPMFARAHVAIAWTWLFEVWWGWTKTPADSLSLAWEHGKKAAELDELDAEVHWLLGDLNMADRKYERTEPEYRRAFELNPSLADPRASWAGVANRLGKPIEGVESMHMAMRLNPNYPIWYTWFYGEAMYGARRYDEAVRILKPLAAQNVVSRLYLSAALCRIGQIEEGRSHWLLALEELPILTAELIEQLEDYQFAKDQAHLAEPLYELGLKR